MMHPLPVIIGVSGESGVGKTTIANLISLYLGRDNVVRLSTDDLHKWERGNINWDDFTHLNPSANNLELGDIHITDLAQGKPIYRSSYNHSTGAFDPPSRVEPRPYVVNEGLHAFYTDAMRQAIGLKIFVDTDEELRTHWKLIRDTESRGYKYNSVMEAIAKRKRDSNFISQQKEAADVVIRLGTHGKIRVLGYKKEDVFLTIGFEYKHATSAQNPMFRFIEKFMLALNDFTKISNIIGNSMELCQDSGGNISVKASDRLMIIKASGYAVKDMHGLSGHSVVDYADIIGKFMDGSISDDASLVRHTNKAVPLDEYKRPSMETGFHARMRKYVVHTHPVYLNVLLCSEKSKAIIERIYGQMQYEYVPYANPGFDISRKLNDSPCSDVYFLENHGLVVSGDDQGEVVRKTLEINALAKDYIANNCGHFVEFSYDFSDMPAQTTYFYPDSAIFLDDPELASHKKEILAAHNYIAIVGRFLGELRPLAAENLSFLRNLESEAYRKSIR